MKVESSPGCSARLADIAQKLGFGTAEEYLSFEANRIYPPSNESLLHSSAEGLVEMIIDYYPLDIDETAFDRPINIINRWINQDHNQQSVQIRRKQLLNSLIYFHPDMAEDEMLVTTQNHLIKSLMGKLYSFSELGYSLPPVVANETKEDEVKKGGINRILEALNTNTNRYQIELSSDEISNFNRLLANLTYFPVFSDSHHLISRLTFNLNKVESDDQLPVEVLYLGLNDGDNYFRASKALIELHHVKPEALEKGLLNELVITALNDNYRIFWSVVPEIINNLDPLSIESSRRFVSIVLEKIKETENPALIADLSYGIDQIFKKPNVINNKNTILLAKDASKLIRVCLNSYIKLSQSAGNAILLAELLQTAANISLLYKTEIDLNPFRKRIEKIAKRLAKETSQIKLPQTFSRFALVRFKGLRTDIESLNRLKEALRYFP